MLEWNANEEIWARSMSSWKEILHDEDPFLFYLTKETRQRLEEAAANLEDF
jgi:Mlc titration factor MtfA (ptsG expression regulator)